MFSDTGELLDKWEIPTRRKNNGKYILSDIVDSIEEKRETFEGNIKGIGVGIPGPVTADGTVLKCANLGWDVFSVSNKLASLTGVGNVKVGNDANVAALGEMWKGGGRGYDSIVMVTLGTGVGGGVILQGKILTGCKGAGGEIGHMKVNMDETRVCGCGNKGCLEQYASATGIVNMAKENWVLALLSLVTAVIVSMKAKGLLKLIPIFCGIIVGYLAAWLFYDLDLSGVRDAAWIGLPQFVFPKFSWEPVLFMIPVAIAPVIEHIGDVYVVNTVAGKDFVKDPGLHRTLLGDGLACFFAGLVGGPPVTTYSEVTGAMSLTKITNPQVIRIAAFSAILFSVIGKISALLKSIPSAVLGGIMLLLFGTIACAGIANLVNNCIDLSRTRNIIIVSLTLTVGIGGAVFTWGEFSLSGIGLAALVGVLLNLILPRND